MAEDEISDIVRNDSPSGDIVPASQGELLPKQPGGGRCTLAQIISRLRHESGLSPAEISAKSGLTRREVFETECFTYNDVQQNPEKYERIVLALGTVTNDSGSYVYEYLAGLNEEAVMELLIPGQ